MLLWLNGWLGVFRTEGLRVRDPLASFFPSIQVRWHMDRGCSTAEKHMIGTLEVVGSNLARCWHFYFFFLSSPTFLHQWSVFDQVPQGGASLSVCCNIFFKWMPSCSALGKISSVYGKKVRQQMARLSPKNTLVQHFNVSGLELIPTYLHTRRKAKSLD